MDESIRKSKEKFKASLVEPTAYFIEELFSRRRHLTGNNLWKEYNRILLSIDLLYSNLTHLTEIRDDKRDIMQQILNFPYRKIAFHLIKNDVIEILDKLFEFQSTIDDHTSVRGIRALAKCVKRVMNSWDAFFYGITFIGQDDVERLQNDIRLFHKNAYFDSRSCSRNMLKIHNRLSDMIAKCKVKSPEDASVCRLKKSHRFKLGNLRFEKEYISTSMGSSPCSSQMKKVEDEGRQHKAKKRQRHEPASYEDQSQSFNALHRHQRKRIKLCFPENEKNRKQELSANFSPSLKQSRETPDLSFTKERDCTKTVWRKHNSNFQPTKEKQNKTGLKKAPHKIASKVLKVESSKRKLQIKTANFCEAHRSNSKVTKFVSTCSSCKDRRVKKLEQLVALKKKAKAKANDNFVFFSREIKNNLV